MAQKNQYFWLWLLLYLNWCQIQLNFTRRIILIRLFPMTDFKKRTLWSSPLMSSKQYCVRHCWCTYGILFLFQIFLHYFSWILAWNALEYKLLGMCSLKARVAVLGNNDLLWRVVPKTAEQQSMWRIILSTWQDLESSRGQASGLISEKLSRLAEQRWENVPYLFMSSLYENITTKISQP